MPSSVCQIGLQKLSRAQISSERYCSILENYGGRFRQQATGPWRQGLGIAQCQAPYVRSDSKSYRVPRFLLNDIVRFWRTMAVDFASKQRDRGGKGWGLRNAKLRMSRKLIFASGLSICFGVALDPELNRKIFTDKSDIKLNLLNHIRQRVRLTPLEILANFMEQYEVPENITKEMFGSYAEFLDLLNDEKSREALKALRASDSRTDPTFNRVREIGEAFQSALDHIFFKNKQIAPLTRKYGVF